MDAAVRSTLPGVPFPAQTCQETGRYRRGRAPDFVPPDREDWHLIGAAVALPDHLLERTRGHQLLERDAKYRLDLLGVEDQLGLLRQQSHERPHQEPARRDVHLLELPDHLDNVR